MSVSSYNMLNLVRDFCSIPSPSGYEKPLTTVFVDRIHEYVDDCYEDIHGNIIAKKIGKSSKSIMLVAHIDEIGFVIKYIERNGYLRFAKIGAVDVSLLKGRNIQIYNGKDIIHGLIGVAPVHFKSVQNNRNNDMEISDLWIDIGVTSKEEAELLVSVGDYGTLESNFHILSNHIISARGMDNKIGIAVLVEILSRFRENTQCTIYVVASIQEEIGLRGAITAAYDIHPDICLAIDVTHATDYPNVNKGKFGDIRLNNGPVIPASPDCSYKIQSKLKTLCRKHNISHQIEVCPENSGTDVHVAQIVRGGCATGLVGIPCRYMHSPVECVSIQDASLVADLIFLFCMESFE